MHSSAVAASSTITAHSARFLRRLPPLGQTYRSCSMREEEAKEIRGDVAGDMGKGYLHIVIAMLAWEEGKKGENRDDGRGKSACMSCRFKNVWALPCIGRLPWLLPAVR